MKNIIKKLNIIILLAIIVVSFSGCRFTTAEKENLNDTIANNQEIQDTETVFEQFIKEHGEEVSLDPVDTTNWQTYTDSERGFSFKHPQDWTLEQKTYEKQKQYKDCYDALGDSGVCDDYDVKALIQNDTFLCLSPQDHRGECYIRFEDLTPRVAHVSSVWEMYEKEYLSFYLGYIQEGKNLEFLEYVLISDRILWNGNFRGKNQRMIQTNLWYAGMNTNEKDINFKTQSGILQSLTFE